MRRTRMDAQAIDDLDQLRGKPVFTYDDERLGTVRDVITVEREGNRRYLVVEGELYGTGRYYVPASEVRTVGPGRILLGTTRDDLQELDWFQPPAGYRP
jgi:sporulation protein YlmC with PRC-barrel domain